MSNTANKYPLLSQVNSPADLKLIPRNQLHVFCQELRHFLLESVSRSSGHLASGLGAIELTVALHYMYQAPQDAIVWDVGHQAYPHKIITGRRDQIHTIRQKDGLHPFPWREESEYDVLSVGHSSTSISAALGIAEAAKQQGLSKHVVAVIGDGALTAGMAFEALNHGGDIAPNVLVILNDNDMSISENVGALNSQFTKLLLSKPYTNLRESSKQLLKDLPHVRKLASKAEEQVKSLVTPGTIFEEFGFNYIGPVDGHDVLGLIDTLQQMKGLTGPQFLHIKTKKGKGYAPAENDPIGYHGVPQFDPQEHNLPQKQPKTPSYSQVFGDWLCEVAAHDPLVAGITPAMREGSGLVEFAKRFPNQYYDVAIAEQHAVTFAAGLAIAGHKPVVAIYSSFLQRAYDQLIHDVALQNLPVLFAIDRAGIVGPDGPTHQGVFDLSYLRSIPNLTIMTPSNEDECRLMLSTGLQLDGPACVRYPRGNGIGVPYSPLEPLEIGKGRLIREGKKIAILSFGTRLQAAQEVAEQLDASLADMRFVKPLDHDLIAQLTASHDLLVTVEDNVLAGGAGSAVLEYLQQENTQVPVELIGLPDEFIKHGSQDEIFTELALDAQGMLERIQRRVERIAATQSSS